MKANPGKVEAVKLDVTNDAQIAAAAKEVQGRDAADQQRRHQSQDRHHRR